MGGLAVDSDASAIERLNCKTEAEGLKISSAKLAWPKKPFSASIDAT